MYVNKSEKVLFLIGMESNIESTIQQMFNIKRENMLILKSCSPMVLHPYGDLMRSIILTVYAENVEEIILLDTKEGEGASIDFEKMMNKDDGNIKEKIKTIDYLFKNCKPEFQGGHIMEWLTGSETTAQGIQNSVKIIRHHPLVPSNIKIKGFLIDKNNENVTKIDVA